MLQITLRTITLLGAFLGTAPAWAHVTVNFENGGLDLVVRETAYDPETEPDEIRILIFMANERIVVRGLNDTLVDGQRERNFELPRRDLIVPIGHGGRPKGLTIALRGLEFTNRGEDIRITANAIFMDDCFTYTNPSCEIHLFGRWIRMSNCFAQRNINVTSGSDLAGNSVQVLDNCVAGRDVDLVGGETVELVDVVAQRMLLVDGGHTRNVVTVTDCIAVIAAEFGLYGGNDELVIDGLDGGGPASSPDEMQWLTIDLGTGSDAVSLANCAAVGANVNIAGGKGTDGIYLPSSSNANSFSIEEITTTGIEWIK